MWWLIGIGIFLLVAAFLWLLVAGADESRRRDKKEKNEKKEK